MNIMRSMDGLGKCLPHFKKKFDKEKYYYFESAHMSLDIWKKYGEKTFLLSSELINGFTNTDVPLNISISDYNFPFDCFLIEGFKKPLIGMYNNIERIEAILYCNSRIARQFGYNIIDEGTPGEKDVMIFGFAPYKQSPAPSVTSMAVTSFKTIQNCTDLNLNDKRNKGFKLILNMLLNTVLYINEPDRDHAHTEKEISKKYKDGSGGKYSRKYISLKAPKSYTSVSPKKTGNKLDKRFMVRGHWKRQPYGKGKLLRKHIWILPFWKGPELSEIVSKPYKVK